MKKSLPATEMPPLEKDEMIYDEPVDRVDYDFGLSRRSFVKVLGAGLLIAAAIPAVAQQEGGRRGGVGGGGARTLGARIHLGKDGTITVLTGKVEGGQGARAELSQAAAEELGVPVAAVQMLMADTATVPDDGGTFGSMSTPRTVPAAGLRQQGRRNCFKRRGRRRAATCEIQTMTYPTHKAGPNGWTDWVFPRRARYNSCCCDCGLVHTLQFRLRRRHIEFRVRLNNRATAAVRRHLRKS